MGGSGIFFSFFSVFGMRSDLKKKHVYIPYNIGNGNVV